MRRALVLVYGLAVLLSSLAPLLANSSEENLQSELLKLKSEFEQKHVPIFEVNIGEIIEKISDLELLDPKTTLPRFFEHDQRDLTNLIEFAKTCSGPKSKKTTTLFKAWTWHQFLCGSLNKLPKNFFDQKPLMHPGGSSFVALALNTENPFFGKEWFEKYSNKLHGIEVLQREYFGKLGFKLTPEQAYGILKNEGAILTNELILISLPRDILGVSKIYKAFQREDFERFLSKRPYMINSAVSSPGCLQKEIGFCWIQGNSSQKKLMIVIYSLVGLMLLGLIGFLGLFAYQRKRLQKQEEKRRLFNLEMLTHEIRTPAAAITILIESFRDQFETLNEKSQRAFLSLCDEVQRLNTVVNASKNYLTTSQETAYGSELKEVNINEFVKGIVSKFDERILFEPSLENKIFQIHPYWISLCVNNLVENALIHGKAPVKILVEQNNEGVWVKVEDEGICEFSNINEMTKPYKKSDSSKGIGLGLSIIRNITELLGLELQFSNSPTRFSLKVSGKQALGYE